VLRKGFAEISSEEKNEYSHRGRAFRKLLAFLEKPEPNNIPPAVRHD
jgi:inosine/xanthosine triphosphate pyrophosphatase family protein